MPRPRKVTLEEKDEKSRAYRKEWYEKNKAVILEKQRLREAEARRKIKVIRVIADKELLSDLLTVLHLTEAYESIRQDKEKYKEEHKEGEEEKEVEL